DVRFGAEVLGGEEAARATGPGHHLVVDQQHAVAPADLADPFHVAGRRHKGAGRGTADGFYDEGKHGLGALAQDLRFQHVGVAARARRLVEVVAIEVDGWRGNL